MPLKGSKHTEEAKKKISQKPSPGRPKSDVSEDLVKRYAMAQCTMKEIAAGVGCSVATLERHFAEIIESAKENGKSSIRMHQFRIMAKKDSAPMAMWLGKEYLGQGKQAGTSTDMSHLDNFVDAIAEERRRQD